jgi:hypothetical protein
LSLLVAFFAIFLSLGLVANATVRADNSVSRPNRLRRTLRFD